MRFTVLLPLPFLLALSACGYAPPGVGAAQAGEQAIREAPEEARGETREEAEARVIAAYRAVQALEPARLGGASAASPKHVGPITADYAQFVNSVVNQAPWRSDPDLYGEIDHWAQPSEFFAKGGDCEDFAMAKMAILRDAGLPDDAMGVEVLRRNDGRGHAVLVIAIDGQEWVLDNLEDQLIPYERYPGEGYYRIGFGKLWLLEAGVAPVTASTL